MNPEDSTFKKADFNKIFEDLQAQAESLFPNIKNEIQAFNDSHIVIEGYQQYLISLDQTPTTISANSVS